LIDEVEDQGPKTGNQTSHGPAPRPWWLLFDLDGTLADPKEGMTKSFQHALSRLGRPSLPASELTQFIGPPLRGTIRRLFATDDPRLIEQGVEYYREYYCDRGIFENVIYDGIPALLATLQSEGFPLYVVTSKPTPLAEQILCHFGLDRYFRQVFGPEFDGHFDDKADLLAHVLRTLSAEPARTIMVGDRETDIRAGKQNGTRTIALAYGFATPGELAATSPDRTCAHPTEIRSAVLSLIS
jgi:phosphoglycolate phosphatase